MGLKNDIIRLFGDKDKDLDALANAVTLTIFDGKAGLDNVIRSLEIVIQDLKLRQNIQDTGQQKLLEEEP